MERGLIWLPLLALITGLTWVGWREYQKVEGYRIWSAQFEQAKYDIYAVIGLKERQLTWGKPTPKGIAELQTFSLQDVKNIKLQLDESLIEADNLPKEKNKAIPQLIFTFDSDNQVVSIPFTELELAAKWQKYLSPLVGVSS